MNDVDAAWAAGFFDGEGCIRCERRKSNGAFYMSITATQAVLEPLQKLIDMFGGDLQYQKREGKEHIISWRAHGGTAESALRSMLPYLTVKRTQAELAIEFQGTVNPKEHRTLAINDEIKTRRVEIYEQMKKEKRPWLTRM